MDDPKDFTNRNRILTDGFSNRASLARYDRLWSDEPGVRALYDAGAQCGGCSFFAPFNADWGLCCYARSRHYLETVFEHFTCPENQAETWGAHSFEEQGTRSGLGLRIPAKKMKERGRRRKT